MADKITRMGGGFIISNHTEYLNDGTQVDVECVDINLSGTLYDTSKLSLNNIDTLGGIPGQILMINEYGVLAWTDYPSQPDKELREKYPSLQISWDRVMEAMGEYEMVKKLVKDYD